MEIGTGMDPIVIARDIPMSSSSPCILDIKGNSLDDGPGIRTVIFFKGCPLSCLWCHNPESKSSPPEISFNSRECIGCLACEKVCPAGAIDHRKRFPVDLKKCTLCFQCCEVCPSKALSPIGMIINIKDIVEKIEKDVPFYRTSGGGVTFSGGEPTLFMDFLSSLAQSLRKRKIHLILETCGLFNINTFMKKVYSYIDMIYMDLKIFDSTIHKKLCGANNEIILDNFAKLQNCYSKGGIEVLPRIPLIPEMTAEEGNLQALATFLRKCEVKKVALLPYNPLWIDKLEIIGSIPELKNDQRMRRWMSVDEVDEGKSIFSGFDSF